MSGLPPTGQMADDVRLRKSNSTKRPISCGGRDLLKKETKSSFFKLRKGSSNSKLNEDIHDNAIMEDVEVKSENYVGRIQGRNFDDEEDDYISNEETNVTMMAKKFEDSDKVLQNPALVGYLLKYLSTHNIDYNGLLYYLVVQHYKATAHLKEFAKEVPRFANEILTTFVLETSTLKINYKIDTLSMLDDLKEHSDLMKIFDKSSTEIYDKCIKDHIYRLRQSIMHGLFNLEVSVDKFKFDAKMSFLNECFKGIIKELENKLPRESNNTVTKEIKEKILYLSDVIVGVKTSLATIYYYFAKTEKDDKADNVSTVSNRHLRSSILGRSTENLNMMSNCVLDRHAIFCSKIHKKQTNILNFRKVKSTKGHNFKEKNFEYPAKCLLCEKLLWGINPQGLSCLHCQEAAHENCKDDVRTNCYKERGRYQRNTTIITQTIKDNDHKIGNNNDDDDISVNSQISASNFIDTKDIQDNKNGMDIDCENHNEVNLISVRDNASISSENAQTVTPNYVVSTATIFVTNTDNGSPINQDTDSICSASDSINELPKTSVEYKKDSHSQLLNPGYIPSGHVKTIAGNYDQKSISRSQSLRKTENNKHGEDNVENTTLPRSNKRGSESVYVQDLVPNSIAWADDPDMRVEETFEANKELEFFTSHLTKDKDKAEYTRLLVLMEFHHKIKFTVMTLKRFDYLLIKQWPKDDMLLFKTLSLNSIIPLYELIKTLDATIERSKTNKSYSEDIAKNVHEWLVSNEESNLQQWLLYSIDLCCTNSLSLVKNSWKEVYRSDPKFSKVLTKRHNKIIMVEQLSNMRPLLFNLPLIVAKIVKDLAKFSKFKDETRHWKEICEKFKKLPTFIDKHCMPLVELINNGTIVNYFDRASWLQKITSADPFYDYVLDFPRTAFHHNLFDFQEIKISNFRESGTKKTQAVFVREVSDAYAICYDNMLVLLQKENDKYYLKPFKANDTSKMNPILMLENVHATKGEYKGAFYELTLVFIKVTVLTQILFTEKDVWLRWHDFIYQMKTKASKLKTEVDITVETLATPIDKYVEIKKKYDEFSLSHSAFFKDDIKLREFDETNVLFQIPNDSNELIVATSFDALNVLKICYENMSGALDDYLIDNVLSLLSTMERRITNYRTSRAKDVLSLDCIESEIVDIQKDEFLNVSPQKSPREPSITEYCDDSGEYFDFGSLPNPQKEACTDDCVYNDTPTADEKLSDIGESSGDDDIDEIVREIIEAALRIVSADSIATDVVPDFIDAELPSIQMSSGISDS